MKRSPLNRISGHPANQKLRKAKKQSKSDLKREWGINPTYTLRYVGIKGIAWYWFARYICERDRQKWGGKCIACGKVKKLQAGHYRAAGGCGADLLMDEYNVNGECEWDNGFNKDHLIGYRKGLAERYGKKCPDILDERYEHRHQVTTKLDFYEIAAHYKIEYELLIQEL